MEERESRRFQKNIGPYLEAIGEYEVLSKPQEVEYAKRIEAGLYAQKLLEDGDERYEVTDLEDLIDEGAAAKQILILHNLKWVATNALDMWTNSIDLADCIQAGNLGLITAVERFDYKQGRKLSNFSRMHIRGAITQLYKDANRYFRYDDPEFEELDSLDRQIAMPSGEKVPLIEFLRDSLISQPEAHFKRDIMEAKVDAILQKELSEEEVDIIRVFYGFYGLLPQTTHQIAASKGIPYTEVRRILREARRKLHGREEELFTAISTLDM